VSLRGKEIREVRLKVVYRGWWGEEGLRVFEKSEERKGRRGWAAKCCYIVSGVLLRSF
jgi:hypothetical protein